MDGTKKAKSIFIKIGFRYDKHASIGIGAMIVFIAMVLVAGIAASVLIQTSNDLEIQALQTGRQTTDEVSSDLDIVRITGEYSSRVIQGNTYNRFHNMTIMVTPLAGSIINLDLAVIQISNESKLSVLKWNNTKFASAPSPNGIFQTPGLFDLGASEFGIIVIEDGDNSCVLGSPVINQGDKVILTVNLSSSFCGFTLKDEISGSVIVEFGSPGIFIFRTPATNFRTIVDFF